MVDRITFFQSYYDAMSDLPADTFKEIMDAVFGYVFYDKEPENLSAIAKGYFILMKPNLDSSLKKASSGKLGGSTPKHDEVKDEANDKQAESKLKANDKQAESNIEEEVEVEKEVEDKKKSVKEKAADRRTHFQPPTLEEVKAYIAKEKFDVNAETWWNYYAGNGWHVGRQKMADWRASVRYWQNRQGTRASPTKPAREDWDETEDIYAEWRNRVNSA